MTSPTSSSTARKASAWRGRSAPEARGRPAVRGTMRSISRSHRSLTTQPAARITRRATFAAAHVLRRPDWDDDRNREVFGACVSEHGHNYVLEVTVTGPLDPDTGMIINLKRLDAVIRSQFIDCVDHRHLNRDVSFLRDVIPTAENVALAAWRVLQPVLLPIDLVRVRVTESENNSAEVVAP